MTLDPEVRKIWEETQRKYDYPVNAIGVRIHPKDAVTLKAWREAGVDAHMKKPAPG